MGQSKRMFIRVGSAVLLTALSATFAGCGRNEAATAAPPPPAVQVAKATARSITEFDEFTGRLEAVERVEIRPRVSGYISSVNFREGSEVRKGDVLFVIDARPYEAELKRAKAELNRARTQRALALSERERALKLHRTNAISQEELDTRLAGSESADANVEAAQAAVEAAELNLTFTKVTAPISGLVSRALITAGNVVSSNETLLTTLVAMDTVYVEFDGDERAYLKYIDIARRSQRQGSRHAQENVWVGLANESGHPHEGKMVFMDNELDRQTGTIRVRGLLDNRDRLFTPGMFARVKLAGSEKYNAVLVNDSAVGTDQSVKFLFVVGANDTVEYRQVKLGPVIDGLRVIREGLKTDEVVVVNGLQHVRPGTPVTPQFVAMGEPLGPRESVVAQIAN